MAPVQTWGAMPGRELVPVGVNVSGYVVPRIVKLKVPSTYPSTALLQISMYPSPAGAGVVGSVTPPLPPELPPPGLPALGAGLLGGGVTGAAGALVTLTTSLELANLTIAAPPAASFRETVSSLRDELTRAAGGLTEIEERVRNSAGAAGSSTTPRFRLPRSETLRGQRQQS